MSLSSSDSPKSLYLLYSAISACLIFWATSCGARLDSHGLIEKSASTDPDVSSIFRVILWDYPISEGSTWTLVGPRASRTLIVDCQSQPYPGFIGSQLIYDLERRNQAIDPDILKSLDTANSTPVLLTAFLPKSARYRVADLEAVFGRDTSVSGYENFMRDYPNMRYIQFWLPGFSNDKKQALVRFVFGPTNHTCTGTYFLVKRHEGWVIKHRFFMQYP